MVCPMITALLLLGLATRTLDIYFIDVEGGAATLIVTPAGESLLVDTGWPRDDERDPKRIAHVAREAGLKQIDYLITTHYHRDHWGGVAAISKLIPVKTYFDHGRMQELQEDPQNFPRLNTAYQQASGGASKALRPRDSIPLRRAGGAADIRLRVLSSNREVLRRPGADNPACVKAQPQADDPSDNARSVGFLLSFGRFHFLDLGDLTWNIEQQLVCPTNAIGNVSLYQVTHHGAANSNPPVLIESVRPLAAVMNNGPRKGGAPEVFQRLAGIPLFQVHRNLATGDTENAPADRIANMGPEDNCLAHYFKATVAADGSYFTITNTRNSLTERFTVK